MRLRSIRCSLAATLFLSPALAAAQQSFTYPPCERTATESDIAAAKGAFQAGNASFNEADYQRAITYWEDAYRRDCTAHLLLLNLARAYELDGQRERAVTALETYLARSPDAASQEAQIKRRIEKLKEQIAEEKPPPAAAPPEPPPSTAPPPDTTGTSSEPLLPDEDSGGGTRPIWPLFLAGGGGVVLLGGGILYLTAASDVEDYEKQCSGRDGCPTKQIADDANSARTLQDVSGVITLVGAAAAITGVALYFVLEPEPEVSRAPGTWHARIEPAAAPGFAGLQLTGGF